LQAGCDQSKKDDETKGIEESKMFELTQSKP